MWGRGGGAGKGEHRGRRGVASQLSKQTVYFLPFVNKTVHTFHVLGIGLCLQFSVSFVLCTVEVACLLQ